MGLFAICHPTPIHVEHTLLSHCNQTIIKFKLPIKSGKFISFINLRGNFISPEMHNGSRDGIPNEDNERP